MNPKTCEHCRHAIMPYKPILSHEGARWHCAKHFAGKWWDETCEKWEPRKVSGKQETDSGKGNG